MQAEELMLLIHAISGIRIIQSMFYSYELLCRKPNGRFAVIWLLSNSRKVSNREVMKIDIPGIM
jgi:hypothetical protein